MTFVKVSRSWTSVLKDLQDQIVCKLADRCQCFGIILCTLLQVFLPCFAPKYLYYYFILLAFSSLTHTFLSLCFINFIPWHLLLQTTFPCVALPCLFTIFHPPLCSSRISVSIFLFVILLHVFSSATQFFLSKRTSCSQRYISNRTKQNNAFEVHTFAQVSS